ncbi:MAG: ubiquitin-like domain-containing protein, partial [Myxococcota bacterium]
MVTGLQRKKDQTQWNPTNHSTSVAGKKSEEVERPKTTDRVDRSPPLENTVTTALKSESKPVKQTSKLSKAPSVELDAKDASLSGTWQPKPLTGIGAAPQLGRQIQVFLKNTSEKTQTKTLSLDATIADLKKAFGIHGDASYLEYRGKPLTRDELTLRDYDVHEGSTINERGRLLGGVGTFPARVYSQTKQDRWQQQRAEFGDDP